MSKLSKFLLKMISGLIILLLLAASIPVFLDVYHGLASHFQLTLALVIPSRVLPDAIQDIIVPGTETVAPAVSEEVVPPTETISPGEPQDAIPPTEIVTVVSPIDVTPPTETVVPAIPQTDKITPSVTPSGPTETVPAAPPVTPTVAGPTPTVEVLPGNNWTATYLVQKGTPIFVQNFAHPSEGCQWLSIAGQVFDPSGNPVKNLVVNVTGTLNGHPIDLLGLTGQADQYGPSGYEIQLGTAPQASTGTLSIQLLDLEGNPLSEKIPFNTSADCTQNVVLINFY
jgi:hypothetical protein